MEPEENGTYGELQQAAILLAQRVELVQSALALSRPERMHNGISVNVKSLNRYLSKLKVYVAEITDLLDIPEYQFNVDHWPGWHNPNSALARYNKVMPRVRLTLDFSWQICDTYDVPSEVLP